MAGVPSLELQADRNPQKTKLEGATPLPTPKVLVCSSTPNWLNPIGTQLTKESGGFQGPSLSHTKSSIEG